MKKPYCQLDATSSQEELEEKNERLKKELEKPREDLFGDFDEDLLAYAEEVLQKASQTKPLQEDLKQWASTLIEDSVKQND